MIESHPDQRPRLRIGLAAVVIADLISFYFSLGDARAGVLAGGLAELLSRPLVAASIILAGVAGAIAFAARPGRLWYGAAPLGALIVLSTVHTQLYGSPWRHLYYSGLCLSGWLVGLSVSRRRGAPTDESYARMGSIALLGAAYFNSGISKIALGGFDWVSGLPIQAVVVAQDGLVGDSVVSAYRSWVVETPAVAAFFSVLTVGFELAGPLMVAGRRSRLCVALGLLAMHLNIYVLTPILYWEAMVLLLLFGLSAEREDVGTLPQSSGSMLAQDRRFALAVVLLTLCAVIVISYQASRFARARHPSAWSVQPPPGPANGVQPSLEAAVPAGLRRVGPFVVGQLLTEKWSIDALTVTDTAIVVALAGEQGRVRFELTCDSAHGSPFDFGQAHILYSQHAEFHALEDAGWALRRQLEQAAEGRDICNRLADWRTAGR